MRRLIWLPILLLAACGAPNEVDYCKNQGVAPGSAEYGQCVQFYFREEASFRSDRVVCDAEADRTYPQSLYSRPSFYHVPHMYVGMGSRGSYGGGWVDVPTDYQQNTELDALRMRIIQPCMQKRGWNSGSTWQAGRHGSVKGKTSGKLPWKHK